MVVLGAGLEGGRRAVRRLPPGGAAARIEQLLLVALVVTSAGGLGLVVGGAGPRESLHYIYAAVALGILPVADSLAKRAAPRVQGIVTVVAALTALVVVVRLFDTG